MKQQETATGKVQSNFTREQVMAVPFDPQGNYMWSPAESFNLNGKEFEFIFNELLAQVSNPYSVEQSVRLMNLYTMFETKLRIGILQGKIKETSSEEVQAAIKKQMEQEPVKETDLEVEG